jgi:hypothetical protein
MKLFLNGCYYSSVRKYSYRLQFHEELRLVFKSLLSFKLSSSDCRGSDEQLPGNDEL